MFTKKSFRLVLFIIVIACALWWSSQGTAREILSPEATLYDLDPVLGRPINISTEDIHEEYPAVAYNSRDKEFLVVWTNFRPGGNDIYAQRYSEQGLFLSWFYIDYGENPAIAYNPKANTYLVVYQKDVGGEYDINASRVDKTGTTQQFSVAHNINQSEANPAVAYNTHPNHDEFIVVWDNIELTTPRVEAQQVAGTVGGGDGGGETIGGRIQVANTADDEYEPDVAYNLNMNEYLVVFTRVTGTERNIYGRRITGSGVPLAETPVITYVKDQHSPSVAAYRLNKDTPYLVVYTDLYHDLHGDIRGMFLQPNGNTLMSPLNISIEPDTEEIQPSIAHSEAWGGYVVTWTQDSMTGLEIYGMRVDDSGVTETKFNISRYGNIFFGCYKGKPGIAVGNTGSLVVWEEYCSLVGYYNIRGRLLGYQQILPLVIRR